MHNYDVLQKYQHITRIGNWSEEWELEQTRMKDYLKSKDNSNLVSLKKENSMALSLKQAQLSKSDDGYLHFGDQLMLFNIQLDAYLACDLSERLGGFEESYSVTCANNLHPCNRSVFIITRYEKEEDEFDGDRIHYGQKFRIQVNPALTDKKLYLTSYAVQPQKCAKFSRFQEVSMSFKDNVDTVWELEHIDSKLRFEAKGQEVRSTEPILVKHTLTQQWLGSDKINYKNQYGTEYEVFAHSYLKYNKTQVLKAEKDGRTVIDISCRNQNEQNLWYFVTAQ